MNEEKNDILEIHYYTGSNEILLETLNNCTKSINNIIKEICKINNVNDIDIFLKPYEAGCFKEIIEFSTKFGGFFLKCLIFKLLVIDNLPDINLHLNNYLNIGKNNTQIIGNNNTNNVSQDNYNTISKNRSEFYKTLKNDKYLSANSDGKVGFTYYNDKNEKISEIINKDKFDDFIINDEEELTATGDGFIKLKSVVLDPKSDNQWSGIYDGKNIIDNNIVVLSINSTINFHMLDKNFKKQIENQKVSFSSNDKIYVKYKVIYKNMNSEIKILKFYVFEVLQFNEKIFNSYKKEQADNSLNELPLFTGYKKYES